MRAEEILAAAECGAALDGLARDLGNTPLVPLTRLFRRPGVRVLAKLEKRNPTGSAKDRSAYGIVRDAWLSGRLLPGGLVIESSSGNFAVAVARLAAVLGFRFVCVADPRASDATLAAVRSYGAQVHRVEEPDPETGDWLAARLARVRELLAADPEAITFDQYSHRAAVRAHANGTMSEIVAQAGVPDRVYVATSTTGTMGGCLSLARERGLATQVMAVDAEGSVLFGGTRGTRLLSGYGAGVVPALAEGLRPAGVRRPSDLDAVLACRALARREGLLAGASTGAVMAAVLADLPSMPRGSTVVGIVHDGGLPYLDTVYDDAWVCEAFGLDAGEVRRLVGRWGE